MQKNLSSDSGRRLGELIAALSLATDLGGGQPMEYALCSCVLAVRLGETLGFSESDLRVAYYQALLRYIGCNTETHLMAAIVGDELGFRLDFAPLYYGHTTQAFGLMIRYIRQANEGASPLHLAQMVAQGVSAWPQLKESLFGHCQVASRFAARLGLEDPIERALIQSFERWAGRGIPGELKGEHIAPAVRLCVLPEADVVAIRRAGLLHDIGRVGVSAGIWGKSGPLSEREWERVRMHPYYTERVLARPPALARLGALASLHHERLDGSGYHRGVPASMLSPAARILAAADVYHAMIEPRPHPPARPPEAAAEELRREVRAGRLDGEAG